jgi:hypothetical protein
VVRSELALANATLGLVGDPNDRQARWNRHLQVAGGQKFMAALRYAETRNTMAMAAQRPGPPKAEMRRPGALTAPDLFDVRRRREVLEVELAKLEAEIQSLSTPEAIDLAQAAEEAERSYKDKRDAAHAADRAARENYCHGTGTPSPATAGIAFQRLQRPNGTSDVRNLPPRATPEQIARGEPPPEARSQPGLHPASPAPRS